MENFYLIVVVVLFALAISDLVVGVANDAVNFLNSAIGSKAAPKWAIFGIASIGVLMGATFSNGMMEVARKGVMHPEMFNFNEIMIIFSAVMITDIILLDLFNTLGMPTSTTVSIVFELLGASVAAASAKLLSTGHTMAELYQYINTDKALAIIAGILISVVIAFTVGAIVHWFVRVVFTFNYQKKIKYIGSIFGGISFAIITYFIVIKGAKGASWLTKEQIEYVLSHTGTILGCIFLVSTILLQILTLLFKTFNPLKVVVMLGTFALAMAFAGNDLVNFIGVPLAGFESFNTWATSGQGPEELMMTSLNNPVQTQTYMLLIAGLIMIATLITSKKAQKVVATSVDLSRQGDGDERFGSSVLSRSIVRVCINTSEKIDRLIGTSLQNAISKRFELPALTEQQQKEAPAFDLLRASTNLVIASMLISIGTSLKLPLSTTYVTFMVAMGTSLSDKAWDRESAVYRISGVFAVIGGWFLTALVAFTVSVIIASLIILGGKGALILFSVIAMALVVRSHFFKKDSTTDYEEDDFPDTTIDIEKVVTKSRQKVVNLYSSASKNYLGGIESFIQNDRKHFKDTMDRVAKMNKKAKKWKNNLDKVVSKLQESDVETGHYYVQIADQLREMAHSVHFINTPLFEHMENNHKPFTQDQIEDIMSLMEGVSDFFAQAVKIVNKDKFGAMHKLINKRTIVLDKLAELEKNQIKRIKNKEVNTRNSVLYFNLLSETKSLMLHCVNSTKAYRDFVGFSSDTDSKFK